MFLGDSQVGKTTLSRLAVEAGHTCLTDENPLIACGPDGIRAYGTPWPGIVGTPTQMSGQLSAVFFLRHESRNVLKPLSAGEAGDRLLRNARFFHWDPETVPKTLEHLDRVARGVPVHDFGFVPAAEAVRVIEEAL